LIKIAQLFQIKIEHTDFMLSVIAIMVNFISLWMTVTGLEELCL